MLSVIQAPAKSPVKQCGRDVFHPSAGGEVIDPRATRREKHLIPTDKDGTDFNLNLLKGCYAQ